MIKNQNMLGIKKRNQNRTYQLKQEKKTTKLVVKLETT